MRVPDFLQFRGANRGPVPGKFNLYLIQTTLAGAEPAHRRFVGQTLGVERRRIAILIRAKKKKREESLLNIASDDRSLSQCR